MPAVLPASSRAGGNTNALVLLASPVYWYTVSAQAKTFIDRLTDLLDHRLISGVSCAESAWPSSRRVPSPRSRHISPNRCA